MKKNQNSEIHFIFDEELERSTEELQEVINTLEEDTKTKKKAEVLEMFARAVALALKKPEPLTSEELKKPPEIEQKPRMLLSRILNRDIRPVVKKIPPRQIPVFEPKFEEPKPEITKKDLIKDKITDKVLAYVKITDKYNLIEPHLDDNEITVLNKVLKKRPKNMEKGWKKIQKYGKKFNIPEDNFTNIKYFVVNFLFGLGKIEPLIYDNDVKEIYCEGPSMPLKVKHIGNMLKTNISYSSKEQLDNFLFELAAKAGQKIKKKNQSVSFNYRDLYFECTVGFKEGETSKFLVKK
ncbi:hypothetical protein HYX16_05165 [Candidatus Woesearchaeota archaeon]|nr:hypothetical protein [Candidatus Woesearchaeota archaeon]